MDVLRSWQMQSWNMHVRDSYIFCISLRRNKKSKVLQKVSLRLMNETWIMRPFYWAVTPF